jgi:hypothetical protein
MSVHTISNPVPRVLPLVVLLIVVSSSANALYPAALRSGCNRHSAVPPSLVKPIRLGGAPLPIVVITGLVLVIHVSYDTDIDRGGPMDGRIKSGHDD